MGSDKEYYWIDSLGGINGPEQWSRLQVLHRQGVIHDETEICVVGDNDWHPYGTVSKTIHTVSACMPIRDENTGIATTRKPFSPNQINDDKCQHNSREFSKCRPLPPAHTAQQFQQVPAVKWYTNKPLLAALSFTLVFMTLVISCAALIYLRQLRSASVNDDMSVPPPYFSKGTNCLAPLTVNIASVTTNQTDLLDGMGITLLAFLTTGSISAKSAFVLEPESVKPLMRAYYQQHPREDFVESKGRTIPDSAFKRFSENVVTIPHHRGAWYCWYLIKTNESWRIDWKASVGYNPVSKVEFEATRPTQPVRLNVTAKLQSSPFLYDPDRFHVEICWGRGRDTGYIRCSVRSDSELGKQLFDALKDGGKKCLIIDCRYPPILPSAEYAEITDVISWDGWRQ